MRGTWAVELWNGTSWDADGTIYKSNESLSIDIMSTQSKVRLANGDNAYFAPETLYNNEPLTMRWLEISPTDAFITKIQNYVKNKSYVRLTDSLGGTYTGTFISLRRVWLLGVENTYDLEATLEQMV